MPIVKAFHLESTMMPKKIMFLLCLIISTHFVTSGIKTIFAPLSQSYLNSQFLAAVGEGDMKKIESLLNDKADLNSVSRTGQTALMLSIIAKNLTFAAFLLKKGCDHRLKDSDGFSPLHKAVMTKQVEMVSLLIKHGATIDTKDAMAWTPLHWATFMNVPKIVSLLIQHGADIQAKDVIGKTPLDRARYKEDIENIYKEYALSKQVHKDL